MTTATKTSATVPASKPGNIKILRDFFGLDGLFILMPGDPAKHIGGMLVPAPKMSLTAFRDDIRATDDGKDANGNPCLTTAERTALVDGIENGSFTY